MTDRPDLSFVIPARDESATLPELITRILGVTGTIGKSCEIIIVDDGSTDDSVAVLRTLADVHDELQVIVFRRNFGKSAGLAAGFAKARGDIVFTMDADLQDDPDEIPRFLEALAASGHGVISGWKAERHDPWHKVLPSRLFNFIVRWMSGVPLHDMNCGFKAYRREVLQEISVYGELHRFVPVLAADRGYTSGEIKVTHHPRKHGVSKFGIERFARGALDLLSVLFLTRYSARPMHLIGGMGILFFVVGFVILFVLSIGWFMGHEIQSRPVFFLGILLLLIGFQTLLTGLLTVMFAHQSRHQKRPDFAVKEEFGAPPGIAAPAEPVGGAAGVPPVITEPERTDKNSNESFF